MRLQQLLIGSASFAAIALGASSAVAAPLPFQGKDRHEGVASCAGSNCHGSNHPAADSHILQNEYLTWERKDAHSNAYKLLLSPAGKRIATNLGLKSAENAAECLTCHTDYVDESQRGRRYQASEGVTCEACHGGAQNWIGPHINGATHQENLANGLYPLEEPVARAKVCLHCHFGSDEKKIDHRIMGAGHMALSVDFELDSNTSNQPAHFKVDEDYRKRKGFESDVKVWAVGQLASAQFLLDGLTSDRFAAHGLFPEFIFFDCNACHHPMQPPRWSAGVAGALGPGDVRLADASLVISGAIIDVLQPASAKQWHEELADLRRACNQSVVKIREAAGPLKKLAGDAAPAIAQHKITRTEAAAIMEKLAAAGVEHDAASYSAAKQIYYALDAFRAWLAQEGVKSAAFDKAMDQMFGAVDATLKYDPDAMRSALRNARTALTGIGG
jgi:hypothetical protein